MTEDLASSKCLPCEGGIPKLDAATCAALLEDIPGWRLENDRLKRQLKFENFIHLMRFVNVLAGLAEDQGHHPDFSVHYDTLDLEVWTHAVGGLSKNDFILAAKINALVG